MTDRSKSNSAANGGFFGEWKRLRWILLELAIVLSIFLWQTLPWRMRLFLLIIVGAVAVSGAVLFGFAYLIARGESREGRVKLGESSSAVLILVLGAIVLAVLLCTAMPGLARIMGV